MDDDQGVLKCGARLAAGLLVLTVCLGVTVPAAAQYETERAASFGGLQLNWTNRFAAGVAIRTQERDYRLVDKQNNPANHNLFQDAYSYTSAGITYDFPAGYFDMCERPFGHWLNNYGPGQLVPSNQPGGGFAGGVFVAVGAILPRILFCLLPAFSPAYDRDQFVCTKPFGARPVNGGLRGAFHPRSISRATAAGQSDAATHMRCAPVPLPRRTCRWHR